ncbi:SGNH/GDSL hydrolase family protein [Arthrobacter sp. C152]
MTTSLARRRKPALGAAAALAIAVGIGAVPAAAAPPAPHVDLVALGDSYTAGTGADGWAWTFPCIQTEGGYVDVLAADPLVELTGNGACHGALLDAAAQPGNVPSVMDQVRAATASGELSGRTELVTLTAGANDVGVNTTLFACSTGTYQACQDAVRTSTEALYALKPALTQAYVAIHQAAPRAAIAVQGYPMLFDPAAGYPVIPVENQELVNHGTTALNQALAEAAADATNKFRANARFVDVTARFTGHAANSLDPWVYFSPLPIPSLDGSPTPDPRNFHPNSTGHQQYAAAVEAVVPIPALARR